MRNDQIRCTRQCYSVLDKQVSPPLPPTPGYGFVRVARYDTVWHGMLRYGTILLRRRRKKTSGYGRIPHGCLSSTVVLSGANITARGWWLSSVFSAGWKGKCLFLCVLFFAGEEKKREGCTNLCFSLRQAVALLLYRSSLSLARFSMPRRAPTSTCRLRIFYPYRTATPAASAPRPAVA